MVLSIGSAAAESRKDYDPLFSLLPLGESSSKQTTQRRAEAEDMGDTSLANWRDGLSSFSGSFIFYVKDIA
jgi:hypothetical protein